MPACSVPFLQSWIHTQQILPGVYGINANYCGPGIPYAWGAGSAHSGGCHMVLGDGSVRFINQNVNNTIVVSLVSIAGGEIHRRLASERKGLG